MQRHDYSTVYLAAWWLVVVTMPWYILPTSISIGLLFLIWIADGNLSEKWNRLKTKKWAWPFVIFFFLHIAGLFYSEDIFSGWFQIESKLPLAALPLMAATGRSLPEGSFRMLKYGFIGSCLVVVLVSLTAAIFAFFNTTGPALNFDPYTTEKFHSLFPEIARFWEYISYRQLSQWVDIHPAFFSMYLILCILIMLQEIFDRKQATPLPVILIILFISFISLLSSRMAFVSLVATASFLTFYHFYTINRLSLGFVVLSSVIALIFVAIWINPVSRFHILIEPLSTPLSIGQNTPHWNSVNLRLLSWEASFQASKTSWPMGAGTGDGQMVLDRYYSSLAIFGYNVNSHNQYLQTYVELGVPGIVTLLLCLYGPAKRAFQNHSLHFSFMLLFGLMCLTESMLARPKGIVFFAIFQSLFLSLDKSDHDR
jgi:O-antigen ligase